MELIEITEQDDYSLRISTPGNTKILILFFALVLGLILTLNFLPIQRLEKFFTSGILVLLSFSLITFFTLYFYFKFLKILFFQAFEVEYYFEKSKDGKFVYFRKILQITSSKKKLPTPNYIVPQQVNFLGNHGFLIYIFHAKAKETLFWNPVMRMFYNFFHPPFIRAELRFTTASESKNISMSIVREIEEYTREEDQSHIQQKTPLMKIDMQIEEVREILSKGVDINARDSIIGNTALFYACGADPELPVVDWGEPNFEVLGELIRSGADVNACNFQNERVLDYIRKVTSQTTGEIPVMTRLRSFLEGNGYRK